MEANGVNQTRPTSVTIASTLLFISLGFYAAGNYLRFYPSPNDFWFILLWVVATVSIFFLLFNMINNGKDWSRLVFGVIFIISLESYLELPPWKSMPNIIIGILFLCHFALQVFALILLFHKESNVWFERLSSATPRSPTTR